MGIHKNERMNRRSSFCPMMKEICCDGHTKSMGDNSDGIPHKCAAWQPVEVHFREENRKSDLYGCSIFEWACDLQTETAKEIYMSGAAVESFKGMVFASLPSQLKSKIMSSEKKMLSKNSNNKVGDEPNEENNGA